MDFMKTLLIYMSATFAFAVQNTAAPSVTPVPAETPAIISEAPASGPTMRVIQGVAPAPSETPAPVPQITPNNKAYHNLAMGAKGKDVRKLQQRLIELGYLPENAADGAYGRQTYNAVRRFQYYNGLSQDGIAGRRTQTYLFENPGVAPAPTATPESTPEPTPSPTATPEPTPEPTSAPTATPKPTPEPTAIPTETPEPTSEPTPIPTGTPEPTPEPTAIPTGTPEPTPEATPDPTETPVSAEIIDEIDLDADRYTEVEGLIAYNESGAPLQWIAVENGVPGSFYPRILENRGKIRVSLDDLVKCLDTWNLTDDGTLVLEAEGHTLTITRTENGYTAAADGKEIPMDAADFDDAGEGRFINVFFLADALGGKAVWDAEEITLILQIPGPGGRD